MDTRAGASEIVVNDGYVRPAKCARTIRKAILAQLALAVMMDLVQCRLADIDKCVAGKVLSADLVHHAPPPRLHRSTRTSTGPVASLVPSVSPLEPTSPAPTPRTGPSASLPVCA